MCSCHLLTCIVHLVTYSNLIYFKNMNCEPSCRHEWCSGYLQSYLVALSSHQLWLHCHLVCCWFTPLLFSFSPHFMISLACHGCQDDIVLQFYHGLSDSDVCVHAHSMLFIFATAMDKVNCSCWLNFLSIMLATTMIPSVGKIVPILDEYVRV